MNCETTLTEIRTVRTNISRSNLDAQIAALLYAVGIVNDDEEILEIKIKKLSDDIVPITISISKGKEVCH